MFFSRHRHDRSRYFVRGAFRRFFVPAMLSSFWLAAAGVADCIFVGNGIGAEGLSAISLGAPVYMFYNILSYGFSIGGSIHFASRLAEGREGEGNRIFATILRFLIVTYLVTVALGYMFLPQLMMILGADPADAVTRSYIRTQLMFVPVMFLQGPFYYFVNADNGPKTAALAMSVSGIADAIFSYIFIIRMGLGVEGSVYSTVVGALLMLAITGWHIITKRGVLRFGTDKMEWKMLPASAVTGFATSLQYLFQFFTLIAVNRLLMRMGGKTAVAAFDVVYNISVLCIAISEGAAIATEPMFSSYRSERNLVNIHMTLEMSCVWSAIISAVAALFLAVYAESVSTLFGMKDGMDLAYTADGIRIYSLSVMPAMVNVVFAGYYQAIFKEGMTYLITFLRTFLVYLLALFCCAAGGMDRFWYLFVITEMLTLCIWLPLAFLRGGILQLNDIDVSRAMSVVVDSTSQDISGMVQKLQDFCSELGSTPKQVMYIGLTVEEICLAIISRFPELMGEIYAQVTAVVDEGETTLYIRDNAYEFNPLAENTDKLKFDEEEHLDLMGIRIVQKNAKEFYYRRYSGFNTLVIRL